MPKPPGDWRDTAVGRAVRALAREFSARTVQFYGGCAMIAFGSDRLAVVGGILVLHAAVAPLLSRREG